MNCRRATPAELRRRPHPGLTVAEANRVKHHDKTDREAMLRLLVPELSARWRDSFRRRLAGRPEDTSERLEGRSENGS